MENNEFEPQTSQSPTGSDDNNQHNLIDRPYMRIEDVEDTVLHTAAQAEEIDDSSYVQQEQVGQYAPTQAPVVVSGKTKVKKKRRFTKFVAFLLVAALIGGAAGGAAGYYAGTHSGNPLQVTKTEKKVVERTSDGNMTVTSIAKQAVPAVVGVYNIGSSRDIFGFNNGNTEAQAYGSGVIVSNDGVIVTNHHVIENASRVVVVTNDGKQYEAELLGKSSSTDLAVLKIKGKDFPYVEIGDSDAIEVGDLAVAIGNPLGSEFSQSVTDGIISGVDRKISSDAGNIGLIQTNASINSGNSGGALLNGEGQLIGINTLKIQSNGVEGMGFAIPSKVVLDFVNDVKNNGGKSNTEKAWLGIRGYNLTEDLAEKLEIDQATGIIVAEVTEGGPAEEAGVKVGDVIVGVDDKAVDDFNVLSDYLTKKKPQDKIKLEIIRDNEKQSIDVTLGTQG